MEGVTGKYFAKSREKKTTRLAQDPEVARKLWEVSEQIVAS
jgi:hypothetical protein